MKWFCRILSTIIMLVAVLFLTLFLVLRDNNLYLYEEVAHALSYVGVIILCVFIAFYSILFIFKFLFVIINSCYYHLSTIQHSDDFNNLLRFRVSAVVNPF